MKILSDSLFAQQLTTLASFLRSRDSDKLTCLIRPENIGILEQIALDINDHDLGKQLSQCVGALEQPPATHSTVFDSPDSLLHVAKILDEVISGLHSLPNTVESGLLDTVLLDRKEKLVQLADQLTGFIAILNDNR